MKEEPRSPASGIGRAARSKLALAIVVVFLLATFAPAGWFRGWLPRWSSPAIALSDWVERRAELLQLRRQSLFTGPKAKAIEAILSADGTVEAVVIGFPSEEEWERIVSKETINSSTTASSQFDDLFVDPPAQTDSPVIEPVQAAD